MNFVISVCIAASFYLALFTATLQTLGCLIINLRCVAEAETSLSEYISMLKYSFIPDYFSPSVVYVAETGPIAYILAIIGA